MHARIETAARDILKDLLSQCTESQQAFFVRIFAPILPGVTSYQEVADRLPQSRIEDAISLCERTIKKNSTPPAAT